MTTDTHTELEIGIANILDDMRTEWLEGLLPKLTEFVAARVRAAQAQALREAADLIAVTKFNDPFGVNREAWKLLRDRADSLDAGDEFQNPED